ncbi:uncharacterized protein AKAME5_001963500 [Lates japonicus]|uniref:Uncharacterized protein n=1 Tax=Lates japonicus TaxID=270547 RepID=A0AAD3N823_LATJO|nr:uncharacterized protein AKAME5_001963500 [Lates japonicus]
MLNRAAALSVMKVAMMMLMILGRGMEAAPTQKEPLASLSHASAVPEKSSALNLSQYLKQWFQSTEAAGVDGTTKTTVRTITAGIRPGRLRINPETASSDKQAQMLKMISALEELHRTLNNTLISRITIMPRANGRNSGRKTKVPPSAEGGVKPTTAPPAADDSTVSRASADVVVPSLTGRNFRKSLPPQNKKTNKRGLLLASCLGYKPIGIYPTATAHQH